LSCAYSLSNENHKRRAGVLNVKRRDLVAVVVTLAAMLTGCTVYPDPPTPTAAASPSVATPPPEASPTEPTDGYVDVGYGMRIPAGGPGDCTAAAVIRISSSEGKTVAEILLPENLVDTGPREFATGEAGHDDQGRVATYTVAAGDVLGVIGDRFCIYNGGLIDHLNGYKGYQAIQPGDVLVLNPQAVPGFAYKDPYK